MAPKRIPSSKTLSSIIPSGSEGGKEFARIIDLLLFQDYRRKGKTITIFNDSAGDFRSLDSFESSGKKTKKTYTGFQYKFFSSPLTNDHRKSIIASVKNADSKFKKGDLKKFILVTPDDLTNSATRLNKGDVEWFEDLTNSLNLDFELEHWGHKKILALFLETPSIGLFYYPELYPEGKNIRKEIFDIKNRYTQNLIELHNSIEFIGMSMYKPEADKGIPMQDIYIPLNVQPDSADESSPLNPLFSLIEGSKTVILGDPGSGKSTLLKFLTLSGISDKIQNRYKCEGNDRLPIHIILRKYADELKSRINLSMLDYIQEYVQATFNLKSFDFSFLEYYLESGKVIFLFDGLDELPDSDFKTIVRDRVRSLITTYPGNTVILTSRIVGYDNPFRFDSKEFNHFKVAKLSLQQMEQFVTDWYEVRIENKSERNANIGDLINILKDQNLTAIRELAENPLLLTIITLVHRIDAVLPDQRVVLYQKCTETLLNTWQTAKFKTAKNKTSIEIRNKRRLEAIAHWMQEQSIGIGKTQRSVVPYCDLLTFLSTFIRETERGLEDDEEIDLANEYIDFIKNRAGLLVEVGDKSYSFVHLTFQEYLTATYLMARSEKMGIVSLKDDIIKYSIDPRWYEVTRLLIASLKSEDSQEFIINSILDLAPTRKNNTAILLGGILLDGVVAAEIRKDEIIEYVILAALKSKTIEEIRPFTGILKNWVSKDNNNFTDIDLAYDKLCVQFKETAIIDLFLLFEACGIQTNHINNQKNKLQSYNENSFGLFHLFFGTDDNFRPFESSLKKIMENVVKFEQFAVTTSPYLNLCGAIILSIHSKYNEDFGLESVYKVLMTALGTGSNSGPFKEIIMNLLLISGRKDIEEIRGKNSVINRNIKNNILDSTIKKLLIDTNIFKNTKGQDMDSLFEIIRGNISLAAPDSLKKITKKENKSSNMGIPPEYFNQLKNGGDFSQILQDTPRLNSSVVEIFMNVFELKSKPLWNEAIRVGYFSNLSNKSFFSERHMLNLIIALKAPFPTSNTLYLASSILLIDTWAILYIPEENPFKNEVNEIIKLTKNVDFLPLKIATLINKIAGGDLNSKDEFEKLYTSGNEDINNLFQEVYWLKK
ncbi:NACHT domain-containing protein [Flavobacterium chungbukense]|uniref:NACHT domain-containing protein n=1 Tax=Flavobacterium chungbukense TaxID=877464 RepID=A0ABP7YL10_9FLAO|nr:NACHT domain-containing protein [Flavobacterium chungbukense]MCC4919965.1 NACHT domain-containing protein [Flavobacterium chungbukense]